MLIITKIIFETYKNNLPLPPLGKNRLLHTNNQYIYQQFFRILPYS